VTYEPNKLLSRLTGLRLYSVQFGPGHLQLRFESDGSNHLPFLDCDVMPRLRYGGSILATSDPGYADVLVGLVSSVVLGTAEAVGDGITLAFEEVTVQLHPAVEDLLDDEIATLGGFDDGASVVWRPGERTFADLEG